MAKSGMRPIVDIYSTFLQRSFDQIFQEVALQNLPVVFCLDRAGLVRPGRTDASWRVRQQLHADLPEHDRHGTRRRTGNPSDAGLRSGKHVASLDSISENKVEHVAREVAPVQLGKAEVLSWGQDGKILSCGTMLSQAVAAADQLRSEGLSVGVINARFVKPVDEAVIARAAATGFVITIEENALMGGFGSAVLESANRQGLNTERFRVLAIPDEFVEHGDRDELLAELGLDTNGLVRAARDFSQHPASTDFRR